jgi:hypothetical protein
MLTLGRALAGAVVVLFLAPVAADVPTLDPGVGRGIRREAEAGSQIMRTLHFLTDVYGPRVTGSPSANAAARWAVRTMDGWGLSNAHLEPWEFGYPGWVNDYLSAHIVSPVRDQLVTEALAWTPGTDGTLRTTAVQLAIPDRPSPSELDAHLAQLRNHVRDRIVLVGRPARVAVTLTPPATRRDEGQLRVRYDAAGSDGGRGRGRGTPSPRPPMTAAQISRRIDEFLVENGASLRVNDAARENGQIAAFHNSTYDITRVVPTVVMRNEDYGRIWRILDDGTRVELEFTIVNTLHPEGRTAYNAIADIEGSDKKDELVMIGGHLDSWQSATGATDNAVGCATMMEAARILKALGVKPRRTIRVALWTGEEQGLLGSRAYIRQHFGSFEEPKNGYARLSAYLNIDNGTGRVRGATVFGPPEAAAAVKRLLAPFSDLGLVGAVATSRRGGGLTDSAAFNEAGLPGINFEQDPIQYESATHHTNLDTYERIIEADVQASAIAIAGVAYQLAMQDELLPRFKKDAMPARGAR